MPSTRLHGARTCCERLIAELDGSEIPGAGFITVSAGVATHRAGTTIERLLAAAARGLDRARADGGARAAARPTESGVNPFRAQAHVIEALATALVERDRYTGEHSAFVVEMARTVAGVLGLDAVEVERIGHAALLHDIGKVGMPDRVLHKPGPLAGEEWDVMREHPVIGERILRSIPGMGSVARIVRHEHERFDGTGYPDRLAGEDIPLGSRIILACDAYHAMTSDRPYRAAMAHGHAVAELVRGAGSQFDPRIVSALVGLLGRGDGQARFTAAALSALKLAGCGHRLRRRRACSTGSTAPRARRAWSSSSSSRPRACRSRTCAPPAATGALLFVGAERAMGGQARYSTREVGERVGVGSGLPRGAAPRAGRARARRRRHRVLGHRRRGGQDRARVPGGRDRRGAAARRRARDRARDGADGRGPAHGGARARARAGPQRGRAHAPLRRSRRGLHAR